MKVMVTGGRKYGNRTIVWEVLDEELASAKDELFWLIHGNCDGADKLSDKWAKRRGIFVIKCPIYKETWRLRGPSAGPIRNRMMIAIQPDLVVAFPGGKGTHGTTKLAKAAGIKIRVIE